ncbi:ArsA family ATPase, partial [Micromonospora sp. KC207]
MTHTGTGAARRLSAARYARLVPSEDAAPQLDVDQILADPGVRIVVCC